MTGTDFSEFMSSLGEVDDFSSKESFDKVYDSMKGHSGELFVLVRPKVCSRMCGGEGIDEDYSPFTSIGILSGEPRFDSNEIVIPTEGRVVNWWDFVSSGVYDNSGSVKFNCINPERISVFNSKERARSDILVYSGSEAVEGSFYSSRDYIIGLNLLGQKIPQGVLDKNKELIIKNKKSASDNLVECIMEPKKYNAAELESRCMDARNWDVLKDMGSISLGKGYSCDVINFAKSYLRDNQF
jgi:hypothetical protein